jgi:hypothetical protein
MRNFPRQLLFIHIKVVLSGDMEEILFMKFLKEESISMDDMRNGGCGDIIKTLQCLNYNSRLPHNRKCGLSEGSEYNEILQRN